MYLNNLSLTNFQKQDILGRLGILNQFCDNSEKLSDSEISFIKNTLPALICILPTCVYPISSFKLPFERLVINENVCGKNIRLKNLADLRYPPREIAKNLDYNRASLNGQTIFYGGSRGHLALAIETQPKMGQRITISKWAHTTGILNMTIICQDATLAMSNPNELLSHYQYYEKTLNQLEPNTQEVVVAIHKFIIKAFTRQVSPDNKKGYLFSALISNLFFSASTDPSDAIYYPSVPCNGSAMNIAIKPDILDGQFQMIEAEEGIVVGSYGNNRWHSFETGLCKSYDQDTLDLIWENKFVPEIDRIKVKERFNVDLD